jgi:glycosyltransferase involved in cell wall biosynthesis
MRFYLLNYAYEEGIRIDSGGYRKIWELSRQLNKAGHEAWVFIPEVEKPTSGIPAPFVTYHVFEKKILRPLSAYVMMFVKPLIHALRYKPDIIYFRTAPTILPIFLAWLTGAKLILEINGDSLTEKRGKKATFFRDLIHFIRVKLIYFSEKLNTAASLLVVTLTEGLKEIIIKRYNVSDDNVYVFESGTNTEHCKPMDVANCRKRFFIDEKKQCIVFIGVLYEHQGLGTLIDAAPEILSKYPDTVFLIGGGGPMAELLQRKVEERKIESSFKFLGVIAYDDLSIFLNTADICVAPFVKSRGEASPLKLFDYMACGKPVVCSDIPSINYLTKQNCGVVAIPPDNSHALATSIIDLLDDDLSRGKMGQLARKYVEKYNSWETITSQLINEIQIKLDQ